MHQLKKKNVRASETLFMTKELHKTNIKRPLRNKFLKSRASVI